MRNTKKYILIFLSSLSVLISFSQDVSKLDENYGFKSIKFGMNINELMPYLEDFEDGYYVYNGTCCKSIFTYEIFALMISVDSKRTINGIFISLNQSFNINEYKKFFNVLVDGFGNPNNSQIDSKYMKFQWVGKKVTLELSSTYDSEINAWNTWINFFLTKDMKNAHEDF
jgi:hypothetical protein